MYAGILKCFVQDTAAEMLATEQLWHTVAFKKMIGSFEYLKIVAEMRKPWS